MAEMKVRGVYFDPERGLFLLKTQKSQPNFTTPGGEIAHDEDRHTGLRAYRRIK
jgi:hypothetical protein